MPTAPDRDSAAPDESRPPRLPDAFWPAVQGFVAPGEWPPAGARADAFVAGCHRHGLLPLLLEQPTPPEPVAAALGRHRALGRLLSARARIFVEGVDRVRELLEGERFAFLKGVDYARRLYGRLERRPMQDVDVLVPRDRYHAVCGSLAARGLRPTFPGTLATRAPEYFERAFFLGDLLVEVHQAFVQPSRHPVDYDAVWSRMHRAGPAEGEWALDPDDALAYQALSLATDQFRVRLIRLLDLWLLAKRAHPDAAADRAREWGASRAYYAALRFAERLFPDLREPHGEAARRRLGPAGRRFVDTWLVPDWVEYDAPRALRPVELFRKLATLDGPGRVLAFGWSQLGGTLRGLAAHQETS